MARRPSFQFYHGDWRSNPKLRAASWADRGLWIDVMCVFADSDEFGLVRWDLKRLADSVPCHVNQLQSLNRQDILKGAAVGHRSQAVTYTDSYGVLHTVLESQPGPIWYSTRMLIDEWKRQRDRANGSKPYTQPPTQPSTLPPHPSQKGKGEMKNLKGIGSGKGGESRAEKDATRLQFLEDLNAKRKPA